MLKYPTLKSALAPRRLAALAAAAFAGALSLTIPALHAAAATLTDSVTVNTTSGLGTIPANAIGLNTAVYDGYMNDAAIPGLLKTAGVNAMRYPGGSYSDIYNWQNQTATGGYVAPNTSFSSFMSTANAAGAAPIVTVNYGTGTPSLAAAWVSNADSNGYNVKYWEVGNEVYGNGTYGANWEADSHCHTSPGGSPVTIGSEPSQTYDCGPTAYASNFLQFQSAMQAANSNAKVCAVLTTPGFWPDGVTNSQYPQSWNQAVLTALGSHTQCVIVHYYPAPSGSSAASMLTTPQDISGIVSTLHSQISQYAKISNPSGVPVIVTETNSTVDMDTQPGALFTADMYMTWLENGAANVDYWNEHNGASGTTQVNGATDYDDQGMFSNNSSIGGVTEPAVDTPFSPYYAVEMLSKLGSPGDTMVNATSGNSLVRVHAVKTAGGAVNVLIDNEDPSNSYTVNLTYNGFTPGSPTVYTLADNANSITSAGQSSASSVTVSPYSITVVHVPGSGGPPPTSPPPSSPPPSSPPPTSPPPSSPPPSSPPPSSPPPSSPPPSSGCAVHYVVNSSWPGGYNASITMTNKSTSAINPWTLTFALPSGQGVQSGWNGTWSQSGQNVTVQAQSWNAGIPANGGQVSIGFNGTESGSTTAPAAFYINGTLCTSN